MAQGVFWILLRRLLDWLHASSSSIISIALTLAFFAWLRWRNNNNNEASNRARSSPPTQTTSNRRLQQAGSSLTLEQQASPSSSAPGWLPTTFASNTTPSQRNAEATAVAAAATAPSTKLQARLQGVRRITISVPGTVLEERQLEDSATVQGEGTAAVLREVLQVRG